MKLFENKASGLTLQQCFSSAHLSIVSLDLHSCNASSSIIPEAT